MSEGTGGATTDPAAIPRRRRSGGALREVALIVVVALILSAIVRTFLFQAFWIPSGSMENTLLPDDRILVSKITTKVSGIERGEVVVFRDPAEWLSPLPATGSVVQQRFRNGLEFVGLAPSQSDRDLVKRVIGVGGDRVQCCDAQGRVSVNGVPLDESSYLFPGDKPSDEPFDVTVPADKLWVMGDHRSASATRGFTSMTLPVRSFLSPTSWVAPCGSCGRSRSGPIWRSPTRSLPSLRLLLGLSANA